MADLKIYKHVRAQAQILVKVDGVDHKVHFKGGRVLSNADELRSETIGGQFFTKDPVLQEAIESRIDYGRLIFAQHKLEIDDEVPLMEEDYDVFPGVGTINEVKNVLKKEYDEVESKDLRSPSDMLSFCRKIGAAFPDFFKEHAHFKPKGIVKKVEQVENVEIEEETDDFEEIEIDFEEVEKMKRDELNKFASELGVISPEKFPTKGKVIEEIKRLA